VRGITKGDYIMSISGFELFLVGGYNPSNLLSALYKGEAECPRPWAVKFLLNRHLGAAAQDDRCRAFICPNPTKIDVAALEKWAVIESLNFGSFQRAELPASIFPFLRGSGRWHAGDRGGWDKLLLEAVLAWVDTTPRRKAEYERVAEYISANPPRGLAVRQEPYRVDRGLLFEKMASSIFSIRETVVAPDYRDNFDGGPAVVIEIGLNKAEVMVGDCLPRWLADRYLGRDPQSIELSDKIDRILSQMTATDDRGLILGCGAPWEFQRASSSKPDDMGGLIKLNNKPHEFDTHRCENIECENCIYRDSVRLTTCTEFMVGLGLEALNPAE
jgi:hypothetical protein